ncbi:sensor histidine kinase [Ruminiclostridium cellobioparum]|uniref:Integral membrane sensor signal transduction histidine kinase n=1 Tax=Ruminiclostridium cellobioparum subsp. termitidis CT1112 TaxID=1195236 RepID=S0FJ73_RUMCE|nr:sensor histidine kinase [Ruminiclostridium cellobioparum]EMS72150.1 integral membrane sensor signal transduction histidine kinase [Ruminiclostridium cellobioparum subsp. termitidis CT1112]
MQKVTKVFKHKIHGNMQQRLMNLSISAKIVAYYLILLAISIGISAVLYSRVNSAIALGPVSNISFQLLHTVSTSTNTVIGNVAEFSKLIVSNDEIQDSLRNTLTNYSFAYQHQADVAVDRLVGGSSYASSIHIFDLRGHKYSAEKGIARTVKITNITQAPWYNEVMKKKGSYILAYNAGGIFNPVSFEGSFISLIRVINDLHTQTPLGILVLNIPEAVLEKSCYDMTNNPDAEILLMDGQDNILIDSDNTSGFDLTKFIYDNEKLNKKYTLWKSDQTEYMVSYLRIDETGWKVASIIPYRELSKESGFIGLVTFLLVAVNSLLLFVGSIFISRTITVPIKKFCEAMKGIEKGEFKKVQLKAGKDEIGRLRDGYNTMVEEIQKLIYRIVEEQKLKRKTELEVLQAQIKPHFLYNTFDSISSLALSGKNQDVYNIMKALGNYYRTSLSKGKELITIGEELDVVSNYLKIQKYRYEDMFSVEYDIDEEVKKYKILKLVLQPFVENALYHGIRPMQKSGSIYIGAKYHGDSIELIIADNGMGMTGEDVQKLTSGKTAREKNSFGIWGTIERLKILYGIEEIVTIESSPGNGTRVIIKIPAEHPQNELPELKTGEA